jgi:hypothetical protein
MTFGDFIGIGIVILIATPSVSSITSVLRDILTELQRIRAVLEAKNDGK